MPGPTGMNAVAGGLPGQSVNPIMQSPAITPPGGAVPTPGISGAPNMLTPGGPGTSGVNALGNNTTNSTKQLTDVFGKGIGGDIQNALANLGSNDSSYMQAYAAAMAPQNAENLATLNTTLGNSGVSANSSTAAIANADFQTGVSTQEGLQEAQLQQTDEQNMLGLLTSTEGAANKEASTSIWGDIGGVLGAVGSDVSTAVGGTDLSKLL
jgi:hypothetical protein